MESPSQSMLKQPNDEDVCNTRSLQEISKFRRYLPQVITFSFNFIQKVFF